MKRIVSQSPEIKEESNLDKESQEKSEENLSLLFAEKKSHKRNVECVFLAI